MGEEAITEIAIYRFDGQKVTDRFISLINPEKKMTILWYDSQGFPTKQCVRHLSFMR